MVHFYILQDPNQRKVLLDKKLPTQKNIVLKHRQWNGTRQERAGGSKD